MNKSHITEHTFSDFPLAPDVIAGLTKAGFTHCTPIQASALPVILAGNDIAGQAQTGTGKTLTFLIGVFHRLLTVASPHEPRPKKNAPRAIILAPTRELAIQIYQDAKVLLETTPLTAGLAYGGEPYEKQKQKLEGGVDILIGTCGRIIDYCKQDFFDLSAIEVVVLDEADRMFDLGFIKDIRYLFKKMPPTTERYNMLFSATLSYRVSELAFEQMNDPVRLDIEPEQKTGVRIKEELFHPSNEHKMRLLQTLIEQEWPDKAIIFANTKQSCELIWGHLDADGHRVGLLTGDVPQNKRERILQQFMDGSIDLLVATDVAARGLHIPSVTHVFNYDLPDDAEDYVHRIGRTGRAGQYGASISFACEDYAVNLPAIEAFIEHTISISNYDPDLLLDNLPRPTPSDYQLSRSRRTTSNHSGARNGQRTSHQHGSTEELKEKRERQKKRQRNYR